MENLNINDIKHLAFLSSLDFENDELEKFQNKINSTLEVLEKVKDCDTRNVEKFYYSHSMNDLREDVSKESLTQDEVLKNSPKSKRGCFAVPQMLEE